MTLQRNQALEDTVPAAAGTLLGAVYIGALGGTMAALLLFAPEEEGAWRVVLLLAIIMASDTLAFFVGHALGRHRLAPAVSPGKTIEGAAGGLVGGVLGALAVRALGLPELPLSTPRAWASSSRCGDRGRSRREPAEALGGSEGLGHALPGPRRHAGPTRQLAVRRPVLYYYFIYLS